jgi:hypothetical protein
MRLAGVLLLGFWLVAIGWYAGPPGAAVQTTDGRAFTGAALTVERALVEQPTGRVTVRGYLVYPDDALLLCARRGDRSSCTGPSIGVTRLDVFSVRGLHHGCCDTGLWTTHQVALLGRVRGGRLAVAPESSLAPCHGSMRVVLARAAHASGVRRLLPPDATFVSSADRARRVAARNRELAKLSPPAVMSDLPRPAYFRVPVSVPLADRVLGSAAVSMVDCDRSEDL